MMSALYLRGLKQGDMQMTVNGLLSAGLFFFLSQAKPLQNISEKRPSNSVFCTAVIMSICGQFIVHFISLLATLELSYNHSSGSQLHVSTDGKFHPDLINTSTYILCTLMQVNNFVVNYRGEPFTQSVQDNQLLWRSVQVIYVIILVLAGGQLEPLNDLLQLTPSPSSQFQIYFILILLFNTVATYSINKLSLLFE
jgi:cation-transporting ATPase 13A1